MSTDPNAFGGDFLDNQVKGPYNGRGLPPGGGGGGGGGGFPSFGGPGGSGSFQPFAQLPTGIGALIQRRLAPPGLGAAGPVGLLGGLQPFQMSPAPAPQAAPAIPGGPTGSALAVRRPMAMSITGAPATPLGGPTQTTQENGGAAPAGPAPWTPEWIQQMLNGGLPGGAGGLPGAPGASPAPAPGQYNPWSQLGGSNTSGSPTGSPYMDAINRMLSQYFSGSGGLNPGSQQLLDRLGLAYTQNAQDLAHQQLTTAGLMGLDPGQRGASALDALAGTDQDRSRLMSQAAANVYGTNDQRMFDLLNEELAHAFGWSSAQQQVGIQEALQNNMAGNQGGWGSLFGGALGTGLGALSGGLGGRLAGIGAGGAAAGGAAAAGGVDAGTQAIIDALSMAAF